MYILANDIFISSEKCRIPVPSSRIITLAISKVENNKDSATILKFTTFKYRTLHFKDSLYFRLKEKRHYDAELH